MPNFSDKDPRVGSAGARATTSRKTCSTPADEFEWNRFDAVRLFIRYSPALATHGWLDSTWLTHVLPEDEPASNAQET